MASTSFGFALPLMLLVVVVVVVVGEDVPHILGGACNTQQIPSDSLSLINLGHVFKAMVKNVYTIGEEFRTSSGGENGLPTFYGHAHCDALSPDYCEACIDILCNAIRASCPNSFGAQMQYGTAQRQYCSIRYETYPI